MVALLQLLLLALDVVLRKVAVLAEPARVVRLIFMLARVSLFFLAKAVVAIVAHVLRIVLLILVRALENLAPLSFPELVDAFLT